MTSALFIIRSMIFTLFIDNEFIEYRISSTYQSTAHAISAHLGVQNGFLVYTVWVIDSGNNIHRVIVDVGNRKVLSSQQLPTGPGMMMMHMMMHGGGMMMGPMMGGFHP